MTTAHGFYEFANAFELGLTKVYKDELPKLKKQYVAWLPEKKASHFFDTEWVVSGLGVMPKKEIGEAIETDKIYNGPTKRHGMQPYAMGLVIQYEALRWDLYKIFRPIVRELAKSAVDRYNLVAYKFLNDSTSTTEAKYQTFQSEVPILATHTRLDGGTWSNRLANNEGLSYEGIQKMVTLMRKLVNERGRYVQVMPNKVIVAAENDWIAKTILQSTLRPNTSDNDMNTLKGEGYSIHSSVYLTNPTYWWMQCDKNNAAFQVCMRLGDNPDLVRDQDARTRNRFMSSYCSFEFAAFNTVGLAGSTGGA